MPFQPSDLAWWGWLLCGVLAGAIFFGFGLLAEWKRGTSYFIATFAIIFGLTTIVCFIIAAIRFVKWVWEG